MAKVSVFRVIVYQELAPQRYGTADQRCLCACYGEASGSMMPIAKAKRILCQLEHNILYPAVTEIWDALKVVHQYLQDQVAQAGAAVRLPEPER